MKNWIGIIALTTAVTACVGNESEVEQIPCGMKACAAPEIDAEWGPDSLELSDGKADTQGVRSALIDLTADGVLDADEMVVLFDEAGRKLSDGELGVIRGALEDTNLEVTDEARQVASDTALAFGLPDDEAQTVLEGNSFDGHGVPAEVTKVLRQARLHGATAYDVNEIDSDGERIWSPYPATTEAFENMTFQYTLVSPRTLQEDMEDTDVEYNMIVGQETLTHPQGFEYKAARYQTGVGGTGNVTSHYDEVYHPDIYARGRSGQKWANNVAILSDGTIHCLPASRRSFRQDLILTNPHLSRGKRMLYNGHLDIRGGVIVGIEMSGRLSKLAAKDKANFIDPIALFEAWGFEMSSNLRVRYGNTNHGVPVRANSVIKSADE